MDKKPIKIYQVAGFDTMNRIDSDKKMRMVHRQGNFNQYSCNDEVHVTHDHDAYSDVLYNVDTLQFAGRYLSNALDDPATDEKPFEKAMTEKEVVFLFRSGLGIVSLWQWSNSIKQFQEYGVANAEDAITAAEGFGQHKGTPIFFAFEYVKESVNDPEPASLAETYFAAIHSIFSSSDENPNDYKMGIYSYGAICRHIKELYPDVYTFCMGSPKLDGNEDVGEVFTDWDIKQSCKEFITDSKMRVDWIMLPENSKKRECTWKHELKIGEIDDQKHRYSCTSADCGVKDKFTYDEEHTYSGNWKEDDDAYHSDSCTVCTHKRRRLHTYGEYSRLDESHHSRTCTVCGHMKIEAHSFPSEWTSNGTDTHERKCLHCEEKQTQPHSFPSAWEPNGAYEHERKCLHCEERRTQPHSFRYISNTAKHIRICTVCGYTDEVDHDFGSWEQDDASKHIRKCKLCGYTEEADHDFGNWVKYNDSNHARKCKVCGYSENVGHNFETWEYNDADTHKRLCPICNWTQIKSHDYSEWQPTRDSHHTHSCSKCGHTETENHSMGKWHDAGIISHERECDKCAYSESAGHNFSTWEDNNEDTHKRTCAVCNRIETQAHNYGGWKNDTETQHKKTCGTCNHKKRENHSFEYTRKDNVVHVKSCSKCDYSKIEDHIPNTLGTKCTKCGSTIERPTPIDSTEDETE